MQSITSDTPTELQPSSGWFRELFRFDVSPLDHESFSGYAADLTLRYVRIAFAICFIFTVIVHGIAITLFGLDIPYQRMMFHARLVIGTMCFVGFSITWLSHWSEQTRIRFLMVVMVLCFGLSYGAMTRMGHLTTPWAWSVLGNVFVTCVFVVPLKTRVAFCSWVLLATLTGVQLADPGNISYSYEDVYRYYYWDVYAGLTIIFSFFAFSFGANYTMSVGKSYRAAWSTQKARDEALTFAESKANEAARAVFERQFAQEDERRRIAHDLHDELGHQLVQFNLGLQDHLESTDNAADRARVQEYITRLDEVRKGVKRVVSALREDSFTRGEIRPMLETTLNEALRSTAIDYQLLVEPEDATIPEDVYTVVFRLLQECLSNAIKYAECTKVEVTTQIFDSHVLFYFRDNGKGFDPAQATSGFGLPGTEERVRRFDGTFAIDSEPGRGTEVTVTIPFEHAS